MSDDFRAYRKTPRFLKPMVITEKMDGTNGGVIIKRQPEGLAADLKVFMPFPERDGEGKYTGYQILVGAQSRNRLVSPGKEDNAGFASWVRLNAGALAYTLGEGYHYGEWWGHGIQRGYGLQKGDRRFSLFNTARWGHFEDPEQSPNIPGLGVVPVIDEGPFNTERAQSDFHWLMNNGSVAAPGYDRPEGIVVFHTAANQVFKMTDSGDKHKGNIAALKVVA